MAIRIELDGGHGPSVARDLSKICPDPSLLMDIESRTIPGPDGGMVTAFGSGGVVLQNRSNPNDTSVVIGTQLIAALTGPNLEGTVVIHGLGSNDISDLDNAHTISRGKDYAAHPTGRSQLRIYRLRYRGL